MIITYCIIGITCLVSYLCFNNRESMMKLAHVPTMVEKHKEYYRLLTSGFVHSDTMHLFFNMFTLYFFGRNIEMVFQHEIMFGENIGTTAYLVFYLSAIVAANAPTFIKNKDNYTYVGIGASGAVSAVIYACILFFPLEPIYIFAALPIPSWLYGILYLAYESYAHKNVNDNVAHDVHFSGAIYGILFITAYNYEILLSCISQIIGAVQSGNILSN